MSIRSKAKSVGAKDRNTKAFLAEIVKAYNKAGDERKAEIVLDYKVGYIAGYAKVPMEDAERILSEGKVSKDNTLAIDAAVASVRYHFKKKGKPSAPTSNARVSKAHRTAAMTFLGMFEGKDRTEQIKHAIAVLNALK